MKLFEPILFENSKIPVWLSFFSPIEIYAISLFPFIFCREKIDSVTLIHETIHYEQTLETLVIGFYVFYLIDYIAGLIKYGDAEESYLNIRAEKEAYANEKDISYLFNRKRYDWLFSNKEKK